MNICHRVILLAVSSVFATATHAGELAASKEDGSVRVTVDGAVFTAYHYEAADRPFFYPLIAPTGDNITRHWPMKDTDKNEERDHKHHRSLWYTHGDVNGHDFWTEGRGPKIVQTALAVETSKDEVVIACENEWRAKNGSIVCTDTRKHTITTDGDSRIIDFEITIKASHGKVVLGDTKEGSMAFRVAPTLRAKGKVAQGSMLNSEGVSGKAAWGKRAKWCDYYGPLNGKTVGIAIMDHNSNPRHPTTWHARDYGLCCANPFGLSYFQKKPKGTGDMEIKAGESVTFKYRVLVHTGTPEDAEVEAHYKRYTDAGSREALKPIFNGEDFSGWKVPQNNIWWKVEDGVIRCKSGPKQKGSTLWSEKQYRNFIVEFDFKMGDGVVDSGIFLRTTNQQVQIGHSGSKKRDMTGSVYVPGKGYPLEAEGVKALLKPRGWNTMKVKVVGTVYTITLNGSEVLVYDDQSGKAVEAGPIGFQLHASRDMAIEFRSIKLAEIDA